MSSKKFALKIGLLSLIFICGALHPDQSLAKGADLRHTDWQSDQQMALDYEQDGNFNQAEKCFISALAKIKIELKTVPPSSFAARYFPLRDELRALYLNQAVNKEKSQPFAKTSDLYKKALRMPGAPQQVWEQYADFLRRNGKEKEADKVEKDGQKHSLYWRKDQ